MKLPFSREEIHILLAIGREVVDQGFRNPELIAERFWYETGRSEDPAWLLGQYLMALYGRYDFLLRPSYVVEEFVHPFDVELTEEDIIIPTPSVLTSQDYTLN